MTAPKPHPANLSPRRFRQATPHGVTFGTTFGEDQYIPPLAESKRQLAPSLQTLVDSVAAGGATIVDQQVVYLGVLTAGYPETIAEGYARVNHRTVVQWLEKDDAFRVAQIDARHHGRLWHVGRLHDAEDAGNVTAIIVALKMSGLFVDTPGVVVNNNQVNIGADPNRPEKGLTKAQLLQAIALMEQREKLVDVKALPVAGSNDGEPSSKGSPI